MAFEGFPQFFLAHAVAHQFWGQAVGWKSYHEQWISEGLAQYFAYLYAERTKGAAVARDVLRQMRRSALQFGDEGPVWLGYRLGHIKADSRVFRAVVYNKGALVLHMLRRLVGEEPFFRALRRFYRSSRFRKVGTDDLQRAFEAETGRELGRFFGVHAGVGPARTHHSDALLRQLGQSLLELTLHRPTVVLDLPAHVVGAVIFEEKSYVSHRMQIPRTRRGNPL